MSTTESSAPAPLTAYEQKREDRIARMRAKADRLNAAASARLSTARATAALIPFGQPILVGHHSEGRHRRDAEKIHNGFAKGFALAEEAEALALRAERAESSTAVSSDDPDALAKLREKVASLEAQKAEWVAINKALRAKDPRAALLKAGFAEEKADEILAVKRTGVQAVLGGERGIPSYQITNTGAEIRRLRDRIVVLEERAAAFPEGHVETVAFEGGRIERDAERVRILHDEKPSAEIIARLKTYGFRWSPTARAWQRQSSNQAWHLARMIAGVAS